jgi:two-component system, cell cycle sensor histidine kinase and response regulator CckA
MESLEMSWQGRPPPDMARTVLLVDDDVELRTAMRDFLARSGLRVLEARNSYDGLFLSAQYGGAIHLLIAEINLLPVSGIKLAENVLRLYPQTQVLCMSACEETRPVKYWMKYLDAAFLPKPFSPFDLHEKVHAILDDRFEDAPMPVPDVRPGAAAGPEAAGPARYSSNSGDPAFWLKEF